MMNKTSVNKGLMEKLVDLIKRTSVDPNLFPTEPVLFATGAGVGGGILASRLMAKNKEKKTDRVKDTIKLYQAIESPNAREESEIDRRLYKKSSLGYDLPIYAASAAVPSYLTYATMRDNKQEEAIKEDQEEVGVLRDTVNEAYRSDLLEAYGIADEEQLKSIVEDLRIQAGDLDKEAIQLPISTPAAVAAGSALGLSGFLLAKNMADKSNPTRLQQKDYINKLDRLYRERLVSPTIRELPFTDEELIAMELYKQEGKKKKVKQIELATPGDTEEINMDDADIQSIIKEL